MVAILNLILILIAGLLFIRPVKGICVLIAYIFLIPAMQFQLGTIVLDTNILILGYSLILILRYFNKLKRIRFKPFLLFFYLFLTLLIITIFSSSKVPLSFATLYFIRNSVRFALFPALLYAVILIEPNALNSIKNTLIVIFFVILLYGVVLLFIPGINPYITLMTLLYNMEDISHTYIVEGSGRLFGRITSVFPHSMEFGSVLCTILFSIVYFYQKNRIPFIIFIVLLILVFVCIIISGTRTPIASLMAAVVIYLLLNNSLKLLIKLILPCILIFIVLSLMPNVSDYIFSMFETDTSDYGGSSIGQRLSQLNGCFLEIRENPLFGNGYQWHANYIYRYGGHPTILAWESIWFVALTDSGVVGVLVWALFILRSCFYLKDKFFITYFLSYIVYISVTGEFGMSIFVIVYAIMLANRRLQVNPNSIN